MKKQSTIHPLVPTGGGRCSSLDASFAQCFVIFLNIVKKHIVKKLKTSYRKSHRSELGNIVPFNKTDNVHPYTRGSLQLTQNFWVYWVSIADLRLKFWVFCRKCCYQKPKLWLWLQVLCITFAYNRCNYLKGCCGKGCGRKGAGGEKSGDVGGKNENARKRCRKSWQDWVFCSEMVPLFIPYICATVDSMW